MMEMTITKWSSNTPSLLKTIPKEELSPHEEIVPKDTNTESDKKEEENITFGDPDIISQTQSLMNICFIINTNFIHLQKIALKKIITRS